ncbi:hypothetical protein D3C81_1700600 [compost metagenome]
MIEVDAGTVITDIDQQHAGAMSCFQCDQTLLRLTSGLALLRAFYAVVDRITQQVADRSFQLFQDVAIDLRRIAYDFQSYRFTERMADVAHHARITVGAVGERTHAASEGFIV